MASKGARIGLAGLGAMVGLVGCVFAGQGLNLIPGSFMTGNRQWFYIGVVMAVIGLVLVVLAARKGPSASS